MVRRLIYVVGPPGVGKTTAMKAATAGLRKVPTVARIDMPSGRPRNLPLVGLFGVRDRHVATEIGRRRAQFGGTDALSMSIHPVAQAWLRTVRHGNLILAEGQRLATVAFLTTALDCRFDVCLVVMSAAPDVLDRRCKERNSDQSSAFRKAALTRVRNLQGWADTHGVRVREIDANGPIGFVTDELAMEILS